MARQRWAALSVARWRIAATTSTRGIAKENVGQTRPTYRHVVITANTKRKIYSLRIMTIAIVILRRKFRTACSFNAWKKARPRKKKKRKKFDTRVGAPSSLTSTCRHCLASPMCATSERCGKAKSAAQQSTPSPPRSLRPKSKASRQADGQRTK